MKKQTIGIYSLVLVLSILTTFSYADTFSIVKNKLGVAQSENPSQSNLTSILDLAKGNDGGVYILIGQSLLERAKIYSPQEVERNLISWGLQKNGAEGSFDGYIAHQNRLRVLYSFLGGLFSIYLGITGYLLLNIIILFLLFREISIYSKSQNLVLLGASVVLAISPIPQRIWVATPDLFLTFLISVTFRILLFGRHKPRSNREIENHFQRILKFRELNLLILIIALNLTKPVFLILGFLFLGLLVVEKGKKIISWLGLTLNAFFALIWVWMKKYNFSPSELFGSQGTTRKITEWKFSPSPEIQFHTLKLFLESSVQPTLSRFPLVAGSELNYAVSQNISFMFLIFISPVIVLVSYKNWSHLILLTTIGVGSIISQSWSGGLGVNYRFLLPYLFISIGLTAHSLASSSLSGFKITDLDSITKV